MEFELRSFDALPDIEIARRAVPIHKPKLGRLGSIICRHGLAEIVGINLLHKHFSLHVNELLVTRRIDIGWTASPLIVEASAVKPFSWKVGRSDESEHRRFVPLEFFASSSDMAAEIEASSAVVANDAFLDEMLAELINLDVADVFGICLLMDRGLSAENVYFERNDRRLRQMTATIVASAVPASDDGVTVWNFKDGSISRSPIAGATKDCAHGNSRHCCGT